MVVVPLSKMPEKFDIDPNAPRGREEAEDSTVTWLRVTAAATLVTSGALLLAGKRRLGLVAAATGVSMAMIEQQGTLKKWWAILPGYIAEIQGVLTQVEGAVEEFAEQREKIGNVLSR